ncbi:MULTISPECIES: hypothetical protein [unclassified Bradyrhizobium]|uniref:hypothetical protein n=1 Tax=unclassified Bradyrhizobium TaxID=2631580 RepID=UPI002FF2EE30
MTDAIAEPPPEGAHPWRTPLWMVGLAVFLVLGGYLLIEYVADQLASILIFSLASLAAFHICFKLLRNHTDEKTLKIVDYLYLILAMFGVVGIIDVQSTIARERYEAVVSRYLPELQKVKPCKLPSGKECDFAKSILSIIPTPERAYFSMSQKLMMMLKGWQDHKLTDEDASKFIGVYEQMTAELEKSAVPYMRPGRSGEDKFIWFYILAVSLALRITKVTVEWREWHVPKAEKPKPTSTAEALAL